MSTGYNRSTFVGNLGSDAETKTVGENTVTKFRIAVSTKRGKKERTNWINCSLWGPRGVAIGTYLTKGKPVLVSGELNIDVVDDKKTNTKQTYVQLEVDDFSFMASTKTEDAF